MNTIIVFSLKHRVLMVVAFVMVMFGGLIAFRQLNIEAYPDPTPPMVESSPRTRAYSAEEIERYITIPIEVATPGCRNLTSIRTISLFGLSDVRAAVHLQLHLRPGAAAGAQPAGQLPPLPEGGSRHLAGLARSAKSYATGWSGRPATSSLDLKTLQDWVLHRRFSGCRASWTSPPGAA